MKQLIDDRRPKRDGAFEINGRALYLSDDEEGLEIARRIIEGRASSFLPVVYVSTYSGTERAFCEDLISRMAHRLGGVAHVVIEPSRAFSFKLKEQVNNSNVYGGAVGFSLPEIGLIRRIYKDAQNQTERAFCDSVQHQVIGMRSQMASKGGWDWGQLQDALARSHRAARSSEPKATDEAKIEALYEALYAEEIKNKDERIQDLEAQLADVRGATAPLVSDGILDSNFAASLSRELWPGELSDRVVKLIEREISRAEDTGMDKRTLAIFERIARSSGVSERAAHLGEKIEAATRDAKKIPRNIKNVLLPLGFREKSDNGHPRLEPAEDLIGIQTVTMPKSPSDRRGQKNLAKQIQANLGIQSLRAK